MPRLQRKSFDQPDDVRRFPNGTVRIATLDETMAMRFRLEPGWRWSNDVAPIARTRSCQLRHIGYTLRGHLGVRLDDGTEMIIGPQEAYEIPAGHDGWVIGDEPYEAVEFTSGDSYARGPEDLGESFLATIVFSDIVDSTAVLQRIGDAAWTMLLRAHNERVRSVIDRHRGREITTLGDGFIALFDGAQKAVRAAAAMDPAVADLGLRIRAGIHTGEVALVGGYARGVAVHAAARIAALASAGEVLISGTTHDSLEGSDLAFEFRGAHELKGLSGPRPVFVLER